MPKGRDDSVRHNFFGCVVLEERLTTSRGIPEVYLQRLTTVVNLCGLG